MVHTLDIGETRLINLGEEGFIIRFYDGEDSIVVGRSAKLIDVWQQIYDEIKKYECERVQNQRRLEL